MTNDFNNIQFEFFRFLRLRCFARLCWVSSFAVHWRSWPFCAFCCTFRTFISHADFANYLFALSHFADYECA